LEFKLLELQRKAAVDHVDRAGRKRSFIRGEVDGECRHLFGRAEPAQRLALDKGAPRRLAAADEAHPCAETRSASDGVSIVPGQIALQRIPWVMKSAATDLVSSITAALVAP
jgi:hypothetical protein